MKTEQEIREFIAELTTAMNAPCRCALEGGEHQFKCQMGRLMMDTVCDYLRWVLGECPHLDKFREQFREEFAAIYGGTNRRE